MQPFEENPANIPAFLGKLWKMVNDPSTDHLISWSMAGNSFVIQNKAQFWYELLPLYYKHNNMSSFVRQLNMYGFHKMSVVESMDCDRDEIQFHHKYFQKDRPELLKNIKRKVNTPRSSENNVQNVVKSDDISKVLTDVKQLRGRQSSVDSQLTAMKQENAVLWRELALLRQKHMKQQQIVTKLIQFLVTLVQPTASSRIGVGVKRRMPLMLNESPPKKSKADKSSNTDGDSGGPVIHELDNEVEVPADELVNAEVVVNSPQTSTASPSAPDVAVSPVEVNADTLLPDDFWDEPEFIEINSLQSHILPDSELVDENVNNLQSGDDVTEKDVFLNPSGRDPLLSNLVNGSYNSNSVSNKNGKKVPKSVQEQDANENNDNHDMTVATRDVKINNGTLCTNDFYREDLDIHLETTQNEIDQLRDFLHGYNSFDANTLLGVSIPGSRLGEKQLFNDEHPEYGLSPSRSENIAPLADMVDISGTELANCKNNAIIDFDELLNDSIEDQDAFEDLPGNEIESTVNTPSTIKLEPGFPPLDKDL